MYIPACQTDFKLIALKYMYWRKKRKKLHCINEGDIDRTTVRCAEVHCFTVTICFEAESLVGTFIHEQTSLWQSGSSFI